MRSLGLPVTHNHALRMSLNSNVFIGIYNLPETVRAALLGHSIETNLYYYSHAPKDNMAELKALFDGTSELEDRRFGSRLPDDNIEDLKTLFDGESSQVTPRSPQNVVDFESYVKKSYVKKKTPRIANSQGFPKNKDECGRWLKPQWGFNGRVQARQARLRPGDLDLGPSLLPHKKGSSQRLNPFYAEDGT